MIQARSMYDLLARWTVPVIFSLFVVLYFANKHYYKWIMKEDRLLEWLTFIFLAVAGVLAIKIALGIRRDNGDYFWFFMIFS